MSDSDLVTASRRAWAGLEALHVIGYFADEPREAYVALGLHPRLSYFAARAAAMGAVGPEVSAATFYVFAPWLHRKALPAAWAVTTPAALVAARREGVRLTLDRIVGTPEVSEALHVAREVCAGLEGPGRPLYAGHAGLDWPEDDLMALWHAATLVREHRGDGHVAVLTAAGLGPIEATVLDGVWSHKSAFLQQTRGWSEEELAQAGDALGSRGWLQAGALTDAGRAAREDLERRTDAVSMTGWERVGLDATNRLSGLLAPLLRTVVDSGVLPADLGRALTNAVA